MENKVIPYGKQHITQEDLDAVNETLLSTYLTQGPKIGEFEKAFAQYVGAEYAVAVSNGTTALHIAALALGLKKGDKVITTPITFAASANCIKYCGAYITFVDIDPDTYLIDLDAVEELLSSVPAGTYSGIVPVDFAGRMVDMARLRQIADNYGIWILEDACHAPGAYIYDKGIKQMAGNGMLADASVFSFHPVKHIACGEGGMITTNNREVFLELNRLRSHGITKGDDPYINSASWASGVEENENIVQYPGWYMEMQQLGFNYRITDMQAALGLSQLKRADNGLERRREIAKRYQEALVNKSYVKGQSGAIEGHAYHLYVGEFEDRLGLYNYLKTKNIYAQVHYIPVHTMPYYQSLGSKIGDMPHAEEYYKHCLSLPMYPTLTNDEQDYVLAQIEAYYAK